MPIKMVEEVNLRFENTLYGYFLDKRIAFRLLIIMCAMRGLSMAFKRL